MSRQEKHAWFNLAVLVLMLVVFVLIAQIHGLRTGRSAIAIIGLIGLSPFLFYPRGKRDAILDERDLLIRRRSERAAHGTFWFLFVCASMTIWLFRRVEGSVSVDVLLMMVLLGTIILVVTESIVTLILYRQGTNDAQ